MNSKIRTQDDIENERQALMAELSGKELDLRKVTDKIGDIRTKLQHNYNQEARLKQAAGLTS